MVGYITSSSFRWSDSICRCIIRTTGMEQAWTKTGKGLLYWLLVWRRPREYFLSPGRSTKDVTRYRMWHVLELASNLRISPGFACSSCVHVCAHTEQTTASIWPTYAYHLALLVPHVYTFVHILNRLQRQSGQLTHITWLFLFLVYTSVHILNRLQRQSLNTAFCPSGV
jgi:hypothetical protein